MTNKEHHTVRIPPKVTGTVLRVLQFLVVSVGFFAWWVAMFLLISLFAVNVWSVTWTQILTWSLLLTAASSAVYLLVMIRRESRKHGGAS